MPSYHTMPHFHEPEQPKRTLCGDMGKLFKYLCPSCCKKGNRQDPSNQKTKEVLNYSSGESDTEFVNPIAALSYFGKVKRLTFLW
jgi:hypothetical protein